VTRQTHLCFFLKEKGLKKWKNSLENKNTLARCSCTQKLERGKKKTQKNPTFFFLPSCFVFSSSSPSRRPPLLQRRPQPRSSLSSQSLSHLSLSLTHSLSRSPATTLSPARQPPLSLPFTGRRSLSYSPAATLSQASALCSLPLSGLSPSLYFSLSLSVICNFVGRGRHAVKSFELLRILIKLSQRN
jgi:hypothetical protein